MARRPKKDKLSKASDPSLFEACLDLPTDPTLDATAAPAPVAKLPALKKTRVRSGEKRARKIARPIADVDKMFAACLARLTEIENWLATPDAPHINRALRLWKSFVDDASHLLEATASLGAPPPALIPIRIHKPHRRR